MAVLQKRQYEKSNSSLPLILKHFKVCPVLQSVHKYISDMYVICFIQISMLNISVDFEARVRVCMYVICNVDTMLGLCGALRFL